MGATSYLPLRIRLAYASGMAGWSILVNIIGVMLPYYYLPPRTAGWEPLIPQIVFFSVFNLLALITTAGRLTDAFYDPLIGQASDRSRHSRGRRIPFMQWSFLPAVILCFLVFYPPQEIATNANAWWLLVTLTLFFVASTTYIIPFNALMPEMTRTSDERVRLATLQQAGFVAGIVIAASTNNLAAWLQEEFLIAEKIKSIELAIALLAVCGGIFMLIPVLVIDERKFSLAKPSHLPLREALRATTGNRNFIIYLAADFAWYMALYIIMSGLLFYVTVLVRESESLGLKLMGTMVGISLLFYPFMSYLSNRFGKKKIVLFAFFILGFVSAGIYGLGEYPVSGQVQLFTFVCLAAFPLAALGILPPAILAGIARADAEKTGENREGLYFAVKYFVVKLGQTFGIAVFATLTLLGQNVGDDFGLRLTGVVVMLLCFSALVVFSFFKGEKG